MRWVFPIKNPLQRHVAANPVAAVKNNLIENPIVDRR